MVTGLINLVWILVKLLRILDIKFLSLLILHASGQFQLRVSGGKTKDACRFYKGIWIKSSRMSLLDVISSKGGPKAEAEGPDLH